MQDDVPPLPAEHAGLLNWLAKEVASRRLSQLAIAEATGVHQSQVSRILAGKAKRSSANVRKLCGYASSLQPSVGSAVREKSNSGIKKTIEGDLARIWDGSAEHAVALLRLIEAIGQVQGVARRVG